MNKELLKRTIQNLKDEYIRNHEVMEEADCQQLLEDMESLTKMMVGARTYPAPDHDRIDILEHYCPVYDKTFVTECLYAGDDCVMEECIGWYWGEPNAKDTIQYSFRNMVAVYNL